MESLLVDSGRNLGVHTMAWKAIMAKLDQVRAKVLADNF